MRKKVTGIAAAAAIAFAAVGTGFVSEAKSGAWKKDSVGSWYSFDDGSYAKSEWIGGWWLSADGYWSYQPQASWKQDSVGWYYQDTSGWYEQDNWEYIDSACYHFDTRGYMSANEWVGGWWLSADGTWTYQPQASWKNDGIGWYYQDTSGYYEKSKTVKIDGKDYTFDDQGYLLEYTMLAPKTGATAEVTFDVTNDNKSAAAKAMNAVLGTITPDGSTKVMDVDGVSKTITNKAGTIYVDDKTLEAYVAKTVSTSTKTSFKIDANLKSIFSGIKLAGNSSYTYDVKLAGATFNDIRVSDGAVTFKANGKAYKGDVIDGVLYVEKNVASADFVKSLQTAGVIDTPTVVDHK